LDLTIESLKASVRFLLRFGLMSLSPENVENETAGTPQSNGSVDAPRMPALPATS